MVRMMINSDKMRQRCICKLINNKLAILFECVYNVHPKLKHQTVATAKRSATFVAQ